LTKPATIVLTQETAVKYFGNEDPIEYTFLDQDFDNLMRADQKPGDLSTLFSMLAIAIACLGLGGLASFVTVQRTKEIGVRKVLGASIPELLLLISKEFIVLVGVALAVATPITYFTMSRFYRISTIASISIFLFFLWQGDGPCSSHS